MQEAATWQAAPAPPPTGTVRRSNLGPLAVLLLLASSMHAWLIGHTEVAARDSIGFIRYAVRLQDEPWAEVARTSEQHPIYPLTVLVASIPVRHFIPGELPDQFVLSAQLASSVAAVLLVIPMFYLGCELFDRRVGFWAAALFQCLPVSAQVTGDALSEAWFLLFATTAIMLASRALRHGSGWQFAWSGLFGGLAYLTRPEGVLIVAAIGLVLIGLQITQAWRRPWRTVALHAACLAGPALVVGSPFIVAIGHITTKPTPQQLLRTGFSQAHSPSPFNMEPRTPTPPVHSNWAVWWPDPNDTKPTMIWGVRALVEEVSKSCHYWAAFLAFVGLVCYRGRLRTSPGALILLLVAAIHGLVLWRMAVVMGYISERHTLLLVLCGLYWATPAALALCDVLAGWIARRAPRWLGNRWQVVATALMVVFMGVGLPAALRPLHYNRAGHRAAGFWLAAHAHPGDVIVDPFCWAHYYAGWVFREGKENEPPASYRPSKFGIVEESDNPHWRLPLLPMALKIKDQGRLVFATPLKSRRANGEILQIWQVEPPPLPSPGKKAIIKPPVNAPAD